jgi:pimeloyl-ACP methyl ester carboxylesterase
LSGGGDGAAGKPTRSGGKDQVKPQVICLPGSVAPAASRYAPLKAAVGDRADLHFKDLELYRGDEPPADYSIEMELGAVDALAQSLGLERFHLIGYSGGGMMSIAYAGTRPERLLSLGLFEPARIPGELTPAEQELFDTLNDKLGGLTGAEFMSAFIHLQVKPGAKLPPPQPPTPEMRKRPGGIATLLRVFETYRFDRERLRECSFPVYYAYGDLSHEEQALKAGILAQLFPDIHVQRFAGIHHFVPPEEIYTASHVEALVGMWRASDGAAARPLTRQPQAR